jgi:hypothetical protein
MWVGQLVPNSSPFWFGDDEATPAQARQVIGHVGPTQSEHVGKLGRVRRAVRQQNEQPTTGVISQSKSDACQHIEVQRLGGDRDHARDCTAVAELLPATRLPLKRTDISLFRLIPAVRMSPQAREIGTSALVTVAVEHVCRPNE